jgi:Centrosome microtubule-binding domain of Cep57
MEDMTSAYIVPDITLRHAGTAAEFQPTTKKQPERVTERHAKNCDICHRILEYGNLHEHKKQKKISIPKPVPASERGLLPTPSNPDPTIRPSESVGLSLARVIKALNDEVCIIKEELKMLESASYNDDPGISKRQRVERERQITMLRKAKNSKSDQVYYLMNVLEGQKSAGQEMTQDEVEVTLQSVGVDSSQLDLKLDAAEDADQAFDESVVIDDDLSDFNPIDSDPPPKPKPKQAVIDGDLSERIGEGPIKSALKKNTMHPWDDLGETEELPFEGFESTGHTTSRSRRSSGSRHRRQPST